MAQATGYLSSRCHQKVTVTQKTMHLAHSGRVNFPKDKLEKSTSFLPHVIKLNVIQSHGNEYTNMLEQIHYDILLPFLRLWRTFCSHFFPRHFELLQFDPDLFCRGPPSFATSSSWSPVHSSIHSHKIISGWFTSEEHSFITRQGKISTCRSIMEYKVNNT